MGNAAENHREAPPVLPTAFPCRHIHSAPCPCHPQPPAPISLPWSGCDLFQLPFAQTAPPLLSGCLPPGNIYSFTKYASPFLHTSPLHRRGGDLRSLRAERRKSGARALRMLPPGGQDQERSRGPRCRRARAKTKGSRGDLGVTAGGQARRRPQVLNTMPSIGRKGLLRSAFRSVSNLIHYAGCPTP